MGIPRPKIKNTGSAPKISIGYLTLITPKQLGLSCPCWKFSTKNFQANNLKSAVKILIYYRIYCRVFIITVLNFKGNYLQHSSQKNFCLFMFFHSNLFRLVHFWTQTSNNNKGYFFYSILSTDFKLEVKNHLI